MASFYMYEVVDGGAGAVASMPSTLFVFSKAQQLLKRLEDEWGDLIMELDDEGVEDFEQRLGVDTHQLWYVRDDEVVERVDFDQFSWLRARDGSEARLSSPDAVERLLNAQREGLMVGLAVDELERTLPPLPALPAKKPLPLKWKIPRSQTLLGDVVRPGWTELKSGQDFFWA